MKNTKNFKNMVKVVGAFALAIVMGVTGMPSFGNFITSGDTDSNTMVKTAQAASARKCHLVGTSNEPGYSDTALTKKKGTIFPTDEITVLSVTSKYCKITWPISGGTKTGYIRTSAILTGTTGPTYYTIKNTTTYQHNNTAAKYGTTTVGDSIIWLGMSNGMVQIKYPVSSSGYKYAFVKASDAAANFSTSKNGSGSNTANSSENYTTAPIANGTYKLVSALDNGYVWDISGGSTSDCANLQLYRDNNTDAQIFVVTYQSDGYYIITNVNSGKAIDCAGGGNSIGTNIWQYTQNSTTAQRWKLTSVGNGYYTLTCKCNGLVADVSGGKVADGTNIQMYTYNATDSQKFKFVATSASSSDSGISSSDAKSAIQNNIYSMAMASVGNKGKIYQNWAGISSSTAWCAAYATYIANQALVNAGYGNSSALAIVPKQTSTAYMVKWYNERRLYHSYATWYNPNRGVGVSANTTLNSYTPQVGDLVAIDNDGVISKGPEHTGLVIAVSGNTITLAEGNTGSGTNATRTVKTYQYKKGTAYWQRTDYSKAKIVGFCSPQY